MFNKIIRRFKFLSILVLSLAGCATAAQTVARPVLFPFQAVQCEPVRTVVCAPDENYPKEHCELDVYLAVAAVNEAVGRKVFDFQGSIKPEDATRAHAQGILVVFGVLDEQLPSDRVLAFAQPKMKIEDGTICVETVFIAVSSEIAIHKGGKSYKPEYVLAHELVHALGAIHADPANNFISRMEPAYNPNQKACFSAADKYTLRAVYNPKANENPWG